MSCPPSPLSLSIASKPDCRPILTTVSSIALERPITLKVFGVSSEVGFALCLISTKYKCLSGYLTISSGVTAPLASVTLVRTISFSIYQRSKHVYSDWMGKNLGFCPLEHVNKNGAYPSLGTIACFGAAGATAGSGITFIACE